MEIPALSWHFTRLVKARSATGKSSIYFLPNMLQTVEVPSRNYHPPKIVLNFNSITDWWLQPETYLSRGAIIPTGKKKNKISKLDE